MLKVCARMHFLLFYGSRKTYDDSTNDANNRVTSEANKCHRQNPFITMEEFLTPKTPSNPYLCRYISPGFVLRILCVATKKYRHRQQSRAHL